MPMRFFIYMILFICPPAVVAQNKVIDKYALEADSLDLLARRYMLRNKQDSAKQLLEKAVVLSHRSGNTMILARCYVDIAGLYILQGKYKKAKEYIDTAWPYVVMTDHYEIRIAALLQRANYYNIGNQRDSSIYYFHEAEKYNIEKYPYRNWVVYMGLGELFNQTNDTGEALTYFRKAYDLTVKREGKPDHIYVLTVFINFYMTRDKTEGAGELVAEYTSLMEERKKNNIIDPMQDLVLNLTNFRLEQNLSFMKAVKENSFKDGSLLQALIANSYIINYYEKRKDIAKALDHAAEGEEIAVKMGGLQHIYGAKKIRYGLLQKAGNYKEASALAENLFSMRDSLLSLEKRDQLYELETKFNTERKEKEIELLTSKNALRDKEIALLISDKTMASLVMQQQLLKQEGLTRENLLMDSIVKREQAYNIVLNKEKGKEVALSAALGRENDLKAIQLKKEKNLRGILIGGALLLLLAGSIILLQYKKQRGKNLVIQKQADDLEVLMKEIHHRVKNNLQIVSSLLDLQSHNITDIQAHEAVKEGKNRVQSMALIHQNLYNEGNIKGIRIKEYVTSLVQTLSDSYNITNDKVRINLNIDDLNLDVDTMIPLGLVLNELVSNSFKYAFRDKPNGELNVSLKEDIDQLHLMVSDNGVGFPEGIDVKTNRSFGLKMIRAFAQKLKAKLDIYTDNGAVVEMKISKFKMV